MTWFPEKTLSRGEDKAGRTRVRLFFALWPPPAVVRALTEWTERASAVCGGRVMRPETLHLTLAFLGDTPVSALPALVKITRNRPLHPDVIMLNRYGAFMQQGILWAGPSSDSSATAALAAVHDTLWANLHSVLARQPMQCFRPHVTLLRGANCRRLPEPPPPIRWYYDGYLLVASCPKEGKARYRVLARSPVPPLGHGQR